ncbi:MAG: DUF5723 family protein [Bacteroidia bacterium]
MLHYFTRISVYVLIFLPGLLSAQSFSGLQTGKTLGIYNLDLQPAALSGQRANLDIMLGGFSSVIQSNYLSVNTQAVRDGSVWTADGSNYKTIFPETLNGKDKNGYFNADFYLPSFSLKLTPDHTVAFTGRLRNFANIDKVTEPTARFAYNGLDVPDQFGTQYRNDGFRFALASYVELGAAWAGKVYENGPHRILAGARLKFMSGLAGTFLYANSLEYSFDNDHILNVHEANFGFAHSTALENVQGNFNPIEDFDRFNLRNTGLGADIGAIYEYKPSGNDYKVRAGLSILDLGSIGFEQSVFSQNFSGSVIGYDLNQLSLDGIAGFDSTVAVEFNYEAGESRFRMALPTVISAQADFRLQQRLYISAVPYIAVKRYGAPHAIHQLSSLTVTPRFEGKGWGLGIPVTLAGGRGPAAGATVRLGPLVMGSATLFNFLLNQDIHAMDVHFGLRIPIAVSKKDKAEKEVKPEEITEPEPKPAKPEPEEKPRPVEKTPKAPREKPVKEPREKQEKIRPEKTTAEKKTKTEKPPKAETTAKAEAEKSKPEKETAVAKETAPAPVPVPAQEKPVQTQPVIEKPAAEPAKTETVVIPSQPQKSDQASKPVADAAPVTPKADPEQARKEAIAQAEEKAKAIAKEAKMKREEMLLKEEEERRKARKTELLSPDRELYEDRDNDGLADKYDQCPDVPGSMARAGCPEPEVAAAQVNEMDHTLGIYSNGPLSRHLPYADYDHDGVVNIEDRCPETPGLASRRGCPENDPRGEKLLDELEIDAFDRIYFESGKDYLSGNSRMVLNKVVTFMKNNPNVKAELAGHADDIGNDPYNDDLSKRRSEAAKNYLISKGVAENRIQLSYYGKRMSIVPNRDETSRQKNRRVEIMISSQ